MINPERNLWVAALVRLVNDLAGVGAGDRDTDRRGFTEAKRFIEHRHDDFATPCHLAGYDPEWVGARIEAALSRSDVGRKGAQRWNQAGGSA